MRDPVLLLFLTGALTGIAVTLLAQRVPDVFLVVKHLLSRPQADRPSRRRFFFG